MSAVLRPSLAISRDRSRIVIRHHHDEAGAEHHEKREQIASPLGLHHAPADRQNFRGQAGCGHRDCFVAHGSISFLSVRKHAKHLPLRRAMHPAAGLCLAGDVEGKTRSPEDQGLGFRPSAFTTIKLVEEAAAETIAEKLSHYHRNFHGASSQLGGLSSFGSIYLSGGE